MPIITPRRDQFIIFDGGSPRVSFAWIKYFESLGVAVNSASDNINEKLPQAGLVNQLLGKVRELERIREVIVATTTSSTIKAFETHICKNVSSINKTLDTNAIKGDIVNIKRRGGEIIVIGTIDGLTNMIINISQWSTKLIFDGTDWSTV